MRWTDNLKSIFTDNITGLCPKCGSNDTQHEYTVVEKPHGFIKMWCNDCGAKAVLDCIVPESNRPLISGKRRVRQKPVAV